MRQLRGTASSHRFLKCQGLPKIDYDALGVSDEPPRRPMTKAKFLPPSDATLKRRERSISPEPRTAYRQVPQLVKVSGTTEASAAMSPRPGSRPEISALCATVPVTVLSLTQVQGSVPSQNRY